MALVFTKRGSSFTTTNATSYATGSFTPSANALMVCILYASSTDTSAADPTGVSGNGVTYQKIGSSHFISGVTTGSLWVGATGASPSAGAVTASGWGSNRTGIGMEVWEVTGAVITTNGADGIGTGSPATNSGTATSGSVSMTDHSSGGGNACLGFFDHTAAENISAGTGCTLDDTGNYATPNRGAGGVHNSGTPPTFANPAASWTTSAAWRGMGVEIVVAGAGSNWTQNVDDTLSLADAQAFDRGLTVADTASLADATSFDRGLVVADTASLADSLSLGIGWFPADSVTMSDSISQQIGRTATVSDSVTMSDAQTFDRGLGIADSVTPTDALTFDRTLSLADTASVADAVAFGVALALSDTVTLADAAGLGVGLSLADTVSLADSTTPSIGKGVTISDSVTMSDAVVFGYGLGLAESLSLADALTFARGLVVSDLVTLADLVDTLHSTPTVATGTMVLTFPYRNARGWRSQPLKPVKFTGLYTFTASYQAGGEGFKVPAARAVYEVHIDPVGVYSFQVTAGRIVASSAGVEVANGTDLSTLGPIPWLALCR